jgi:hypothetical protein
VLRKATYETAVQRRATVLQRDETFRATAC